MIFFSFKILAFLCPVNADLLTPRSQDWSPMFSSKSFTVFPFTFSSANRLELIFVSNGRQESRDTFFTWISNCPSTIYWKSHLFPTGPWCHLCHKCGNHLRVVFFQTLCSVPLVNLFILVPAAQCLNNYSFIRSLGIQFCFFSSRLPWLFLGTVLAMPLF